MSDILAKLKQGTNHIKLSVFPGTTQAIAFKILSQQDLQDAAFATERLFTSSKIELNLASAQEYDEEKSTQILFRALRDPAKQDETVAPDITTFRKLLTREEKAVLIDEYLTFEKDCSPRSDTLSSEEFDKLVSDLKKKPDSISKHGSFSHMVSFKGTL
jgi:hypothetical protein